MSDDDIDVDEDFLVSFLFELATAVDLLTFHNRVTFAVVVEAFRGAGEGNGPAHAASTPVP